MTLKSSPPTLWSAVALTTLSLATVLALQARAADDKKPAAAASAPATANGNIAAWQEASVGAEANGLRLARCKVNVGEAVRRGQVLATLCDDTLQADLAQTAGQRGRGRGHAGRGRANAQRARDLQVSGALSASRSTST
jgi:HlyD family secretion protein